jgi:hypothetical protein
MWQRLKMQMLQSMRLGLVRDVIQSMDKDDLVHYLYLFLICLAAWGGYVMGINHG